MSLDKELVTKESALDTDESVLLGGDVAVLVSSDIVVESSASAGMGSTARKEPPMICIVRTARDTEAVYLFADE